MTNDKGNLQKFIVVEGPIGVGKTTLTRKLALTLGASVVLEDPASNPFLKRFYENPQDGALPAQLYFLFQRHKQMKQLMQPDLFSPNVIADYIIDKDQLFASETLDDDEYELYQQVYKHLIMQHPTPDLVIYLQAPTEVLMERVRNRKRDEERSMQPEYLAKISTAYTQFFHYYSDSPLLIVNASGVDLVNNEAHYTELVNRIDSTRSGRNYFNPLTD
jgi:deoxyadenosine/deoxycytidine kinase